MKNGKYELVIAPKLYPGTKYRKRYAYEHHVIWWLSTGEIVPKGYLIHHKNKNKRDNKISNLEILKWGNHSVMHGKGHRARPAKARCSWCNVVFETNARNLRFKKKSGQIRFYCSRSHQVSHQHQIKRRRAWTKVSTND